MARKSCDCIIGDAQQGDPVREIVNRSDFLRRCGYSPTQGWMMRSSKDTTQATPRESGKKRARKSQLPEELSRINLNTAGINVGGSSHFVAVPADRSEPQVQEFCAYTADLYRLADWLTDCEIETVAMESTGVYWIPLFGVLEDRGFEVMLVDPRRIKDVPGRKSDVLDCQWLQQLHTYGLLSAAFRPEAEIRCLRSYLRQRSMLVRDASQHIQHIQKALVGDLQVAVDGSLQLGAALVHPTAQLLFGEQPEPALHQVQPGGAGGREMNMEAGPFGEPVPDQRRLVGGVVVRNQVHVQLSGHRELDGIQKLAELQGPVAAVALANHLAGLGVQSGKERRGAVAHVIMSAPLHLARAQGEEPKVLS